MFGLPIGTAPVANLVVSKKRRGDTDIPWNSTYTRLQNFVIIIICYGVKVAEERRLPIVTVSDGVEYSTSEYEYRNKLWVRVLILKSVLEYEYHKKVRVRVLLPV